MKNRIANTPEQRGFVLILVLILLMIATLVGMVGMSSGAMQERMTGNQNNKAIAFMAAEAGAAELLAWIDENGWPDDDNRPPASGFVTNDQSRAYRLSLASGTWSDPSLKILVEGSSMIEGSTLASTAIAVRLDQQTAGGLMDAPAAISCFGGGCNITAGAGQGADKGYGTISGYDHPIPPLGCSGGNCRMEPKKPRIPVAPALYLDAADNSHVGKQGGGNHLPYQGLGPNGETVSGSDKSIALGPDDYGDDPDTGNSLAPDLDAIFGGTEPVTDTWKEKNALRGLLVVDNEHFSMSGSGLFVGLIVIKNCGTVSMSGNPNVYGAIIVDASGCDQPYDPFKGNGTPAVRYSLDALNALGLGGAGGYVINRWSEWL